jgi:hypothetical protein
MFKKKSIGESSAGLVEEALKEGATSNTSSPEKGKESVVSQATMTDTTSTASNVESGAAMDGK